MKTLIWFHRDMRIHDHYGLTWAMSHAKEIDAIAFAPRNASENKLKFWHECAKDLKKNLIHLGIELRVSEEPVETILPDLITELKIDLILTHERMNIRDHNQLTKLRKICSSEIRETGELTLFPSSLADSLKLSDLKPFTKFKNFVEANLAIPDEIPPSVVENSSALERLHFYIWESQSVRHYHETRNGLIEINDSSKFSPWLSWGALSPRRVYGELKKYESENGKNEGIDALIHELIWRDYFKFLAKVQGDSFFHRDGMKESPFIYRKEPSLFLSWCKGETGVDFVDANMRELFLTGRMSNRGRQNVASFLSKTLKLDWTLGAEWFENLLIDEDPENNFGNWQYLAGVGTDPRNRIFDVQRQASLYDPDGIYQSQWLKRDREIAEKILQLLSQRSSEATICPSEVLPPELKKDKTRMEEVRACARRLWRLGQIEFTQKSFIIDPYHVKGPVRLRLTTSGNMS